MRRNLLPFQQGQQAAALNLVASRQVEKICQGGHHINGTYLLVYRLAWGNFRPPHNQWNMHGGVVEKNPVSKFPMISQTLAMVRHQHYQRLLT